MKSQIKTLLILVIIADLLVGAGYFFLFNYVKNQAESLSVLVSKLDLTEQRNSRLNELRAIVNQTESERSQIASYLLASGEEVNFIDKIEALAKQSGLDEKTSNVSQISGQIADTKILQISVAVTGSWNNVAYFLAQLENLPYAIHIPRVTLTEQSASSQKSANIWSGNFDISVVENI